MRVSGWCRRPAAASCRCLQAKHLSALPLHLCLAAFLEELRDYSMKLHTKSQAPKEGQAPEKKDQKPVGWDVGGCRRVGLAGGCFCRYWSGAATDISSGAKRRGLH